MSLDRLIDLAKKTGDRLIVHDPVAERDVVIMDVNQYLELRTVGARATKHLSDSELLDQINRDIALWRARQQSEAVDNEIMEDEFGDDEEGFDPMPNDGSEWSSPGQLFARQAAQAQMPSKPKAETSTNTTVPAASVDAAAPVLTPLPYRQEDNSEWKEESIGEAEGDEPVFYEEPIS